MKKSFVKAWLSNQTNYQIVKPEKVGRKEFLSIFFEKRYSLQIDLTFSPRYKNIIKIIVYYLQLLTLDPVSLRLLFKR